MAYTPQITKPAVKSAATIAILSDFVIGFLFFFFSAFRSFLLSFVGFILSPLSFFVDTTGSMRTVGESVLLIKSGGAILAKLSAVFLAICKSSSIAFALGKRFACSLLIALSTIFSTICGISGLI